MRWFAVLATVTITLLVTGARAHAFNCPIAMMQAEDLVRKAEARATARTRPLVDEARKTLGEARAHHERAAGRQDHAEAVRKARIAAALAEEALGETLGLRAP